jgi:hypothetical protein
MEVPRRDIVPRLPAVEPVVVGTPLGVAPRTPTAAFRPFRRAWSRTPPSLDTHGGPYASAIQGSTPPPSPLRVLRRNTRIVPAAPSALFEPIAPRRVRVGPAHFPGRRLSMDSADADAAGAVEDDILPLMAHIRLTPSPGTQGRTSMSDDSAWGSEGGISTDHDL